MDKQDRDMLIRIDARMEEWHERLPIIEEQISDNTSNIDKMKGVLICISVVLVPVSVAVISAHLK